MLLAAGERSGAAGAIGSAGTDRTGAHQPAGDPAVPGFVVFDRVGRSFGASIALQGLSLSVAPGEFVSLLGPSGSGNSTTLNLLAGFDYPTSGTIHIGGREVTWEPAYARAIGMVFQNYALFPHMTVSENVAFPLRSRRWPKAEIRPAVERALRLVQLQTFGERLPNQLSGGQQQRVALARAIVYQPKVLLMDEPLGALDRKLRVEMQIEIKRLHRELGTTFLYVTHDQEEALSMSDRIAILNGGRLEQIGTPTQVYSQPATPFVAGFVGEVTFLPGIVEPGGTTIRLHDVDLVVPLRGGPRAIGTRATLAIRPEHVAVTPGTQGSVEETLYFGNLLKCIVRIGDRRITTSMPIGGGAMPRPGDRVGIHLDADATIVFAQT